MILDGRKLRTEIEAELRDRIRYYKTKPHLTIIMVGDDNASKVYVRNKIKACERVGINSELICLDGSICEKDLKQIVIEKSNDPKVNGLLIQLPLPNHIDREMILDLIDPKKDVDGLTSENTGRLMRGMEAIIPATPKGIMRLLDEYKINLKGKKVLVIGRSNLVGKPVALLCLSKNATVTIAHSKTKNLDELISNAELIISSASVPNLLNKNNVSEGTVIVDVSTNLYQAKMVGDACFEEVYPLCKYISPVPGGVGPMTIASLLENTIICFEEQKK